MRPAWVRFAALGDTERGFAQFGGETWCYVRRGPYGAFAVAGPGARPGLVLDQMDQGLLAAEKARARNDVAGSRPDEISMPPSRPRTFLHAEPHHGKEPVVISVPRGESAFGDPTKDPRKDRPSDPRKDLGLGLFPAAFRPALQPAAAPETVPETAAVPDTSAEFEADGEAGAPGMDGRPRGGAAWGSWKGAEPARAPNTPDLDLAGHEGSEAGEPADRSSKPDETEATASDAGDDPWEPGAQEQDDIDRFSLAREFGQLLQRGEDPADG